KRRMPYEGRLQLTRNFRSQPAILDFANALFGPVASEPRAPASGSGTLPLFNGLEDYEPLEAHHAQVNPGPCVEFLWSPHDGGSVAQARAAEAGWIARRIAQMILDQEKLVVQRGPAGEELRPVRPGDVVLLFRAMTNVEIYEAALRRHGLNYYLVGGRA